MSKLLFLPDRNGREKESEGAGLVRLSADTSEMAALAKRMVIRQETDLGTCFFDRTGIDDLQLIHGFSALIPLEVNLSIVINAHLKPVGQRIYNGCTYTMQTTGYLVSPTAKLTAEIGRASCRERV